MKVESVRAIVVHVVDTDKREFPTFIRYGPDHWMNTMGSSDEPVYETEELEKAFQDFQATEEAKKAVRP